MDTSVSDNISDMSGCGTPLFSLMQNACVHVFANHYYAYKLVYKKFQLEWDQVEVAQFTLFIGGG